MSRAVKLRNEAAMETVRAMLEKQYGRPVNITDALDFALHQTALKIDADYQKKAKAVAS